MGFSSNNVSKELIGKKNQNKTHESILGDKKEVFFSQQIFVSTANKQINISSTIDY